MATNTSDNITVTEDEWTDFKKKHNKSYKDDSDEVIHRKNYLENKIRVTEHNKKYESGEATFQMGINHFSDLSAEERSKLHGPPMRRTNV